MLIVDASCLISVLTGSGSFNMISDFMKINSEQCAPHIIEVETLNVIRRAFLNGQIDGTTANQAVEDLRNWPGERFSHVGLIERAWELKHNLRGWDAFYVALAESLDAPLITLDSKLAKIKGLACKVILFP